MANRLASEKSAYLRSAANQPIDWFPWGEAAFAEAKRLDKPILLDIGAVWCHWCHVIDHESYDDPAIGALINERFVAVKVDRDERPDVDARYQKVVQATTGQGGWPLTAFLTPEGRVYFGGTYFPPVEAHGRPSFRRVLEAVSDAYRERKGEMVEHAGKILEAIEARATRSRQTVGEIVSEALLTEAVASLESEFDAVNGGWGSAPKFPHPGAMTFLLRYEARHASETLRDVATTTLDRMAKGGVYDHVAGGFHRYSVDAKWIVPHFEKMLYDNAELLRNYAHAHARWPTAGWDAKAADIVRFLASVLERAEGGFGGSQDADASPHDDGDFFTWTLAELERAVNDAEIAKVLALHFDVKERGEMHHNPAKNVLWVAAEPEDIASALKTTPEDVRAKIAEGLQRLAVARATRQAPFVDPVVYVAWNAMAASALLEFAAATGRDDARDRAIRAVDRALAEAWDAKRGFSRTLGGKPVHGILDDHAQMLPALLDAFNATQDARYLDAARAVADLLISEFVHPEGGFADLARRLADPTVASLSLERPLQDAPSPSANARAFEGLLRLAQVTGEERFALRAQVALEATADEARRYGLFAGAWFHAADLALHAPPHILVAAPVGSALHRAALAGYAPGRTVRVVEPGSKATLPEAQAFIDGLARSREGALVCVGTRCLAPAWSATELALRLEGAQRS